MKRSAVALLLLVRVGAIDNGLGRTPPMGWRSWNLFGLDVNQSLIMSIMDAMVSKKRVVDGVPTSLCGLGYCDVGLDDGWQKCGGGGGGYNYHDAAGNPVVNRARFPDMANMTAHAHGLRLTAGWYGNNCECREKAKATHAMYEADVKDLADVFHFDGVKLDGCGTEYDLDLWSQLINKTGRPIMIENCHWGETVPTESWCPWNFFRTSGDIRASYGSLVGNLLTTVQWAQKGLSRPGCWAYPDMLEVGCRHGPGGASDPGLSFIEERSHFGAWCIVSSPLTLSHDVRNDAVMDEIWPIISNIEAIAINQAWAGHSGSPFKQSKARALLDDFNMVVRGVVTPHDGEVPSWQYYYKSLRMGRVAVLMLNHDSRTQHLRLDFADVPGLHCSLCKVRDVWRREDLPPCDGAFEADLASHDSIFLVLAPSEALVQLII